MVSRRSGPELIEGRHLEGRRQDVKDKLMGAFVGRTLGGTGVTGLGMSGKG